MFDKCFNYTIKDRIENKINVNFVIPKDLVYFEGHFKNRPILPAIIIIEINHWLVKKLFQKNANRNIESIKKQNFFQL